jgi:N-acetylmuramic acid 6-phosphate etherase
VRPDVLEHADRPRTTEDDAARTTRYRRVRRRGSRDRSDDVVLGVSASGRTPYTLAALAQAKVGRRSDSCRRRAREDRSSPQSRDVAIEVDVGPEVIAGSTRMKAGTAQKLVLNIDLDDHDGSAGQDLREPHGRRPGFEREASARAVARSRSRTAASEDEAAAAIAAADGDAKVAIVSLLAGIDADARGRGFSAGGVVREAVADVVG